MKKQLPNILLVLVFIIGFCIFLYPPLSDFINSLIHSKEISKYEHLTSELSFEQYDKMILEAEEYNKTLVGNLLIQNIDKSRKSDYKQLLSLDNSGIMGYLYINKIDVRLPIYHGTDASTLQKGVGHLEGSSLPVGGETQHVVLSGHTGLPSAKIFTDLVELEVGDTFKIDALNQTYTYEVDQILEVEPNETENLEIVDGKQYATLITCTPYGVNTHRLLVRGVLKNDKIDVNISADAVMIETNLRIPLSIILVIIFVILAFVNRQKSSKNHII